MNTFIALFLVAFGILLIVIRPVGNLASKIILIDKYLINTADKL